MSWIAQELKPARGKYVLVKLENGDVSIAKWNGVYWQNKVFGEKGIVIIKAVRFWQLIPE